MNHVHRGGSLTLESYPENRNRPVSEKEPDAGAFQQLGRERFPTQGAGGNPKPDQPSPNRPKQQDRGSNQRGYSQLFAVSSHSGARVGIG